MSLRRSELDGLHGANDFRSDLVGVSIGSGAAVFEPAFPAIGDGRDRDADGGTAV